MSDQETEADTANTISVDEIYELFTHQRRREVLSCLNKYGSLSLADLAEKVARREQDASLKEISEKDVVRVHMSLWHAHIPKLSEADIVDYDQDADIVRLAQNDEQIKRALHQEISGTEEAT